MLAVCVILLLLLGMGKCVLGVGLDRTVLVKDRRQMTKKTTPSFRQLVLPVKGNSNSKSKSIFG